jgi:integrase
MSDTDDQTTHPVDTPNPSAIGLPGGYPGGEQANDAQREDEAAFSAHIAHHWQPTLNRWLLTLNPGRTQDEYAKAVRYFFETPGAPQDLDALTYDMLLAYRGALTLRADRRRRSMPRRAATASGRLSPWAPGALHGAADSQAQGEAGRAHTPASLRSGPLSPATVNIRLTALRQYALYAIEQRLIVALSAEQVRSALRRLRNERRRPYQILAEEEWDEFLHAALGPPERAPDETRAAPDGSDVAAPPTLPPPQPPKARGPWGTTRAVRQQASQRLSESEVEAPATPTMPEEASPLAAAVKPARGHDGRTGARTAQRDHALISLALATGLRAIELSLLDVGDLVSERRRGHTEWWLSLPDEKTKGQRGGRTLPLAPELVATLLAYIHATDRAWENAEHRASPLFLALSRGRAPVVDSSTSRALRLAQDGQERRYRRLRPEQIRSVIHRVEGQWLALRRATEDADDSDASQSVGDALRHISPHTLRHSAAIALLLGDEMSERPPASVEHVRGWLGHFDIRTTQRYLAHLESRDQRRRFAIRPQPHKATEATPDVTSDQPARFDRDTPPAS